MPAAAGLPQWLQIVTLLLHALRSASDDSRSPCLHLRGARLRQRDAGQAAHDVVPSRMHIKGCPLLLNLQQRPNLHRIGPSMPAKLPCLTLLQAQL